jgi:hypothetical protein
MLPALDRVGLEDLLEQPTVVGVSLVQSLIQPLIQPVDQNLLPVNLSLVLDESLDRGFHGSGHDVKDALHGSVQNRKT